MEIDWTVIGVGVALAGLNLTQSRSLRGEIRELRREVGARCDKLDKRIDTLSDRLDRRIDALCDRIDTRTDTLSERLANLGRELGERIAKIEAILLGTKALRRED